MKMKRCFTIVAVLIGGLLMTSSGWGQGVTSSSISGQVRDLGGNPVSDARVSALHVPTGSTYRTTSGTSGRYNFSNLRVGGPYTIKVDVSGMQPAERENIFTALGQRTEVNVDVRVDESEIVDLEAFNVEAGPGAELFNPNVTGINTTFNSQEILTTPTTRRHLNDIARLNPFVSITEEDRNELTAAGQNNRFNSIMLDGVRINDQFGLDSSGVQSFRNPVSFEALEAVTVDISPYDVRQSGFTGAAINAITKSGTNEFSGSVYTYYTDANYRGDVFGNNDLFRETTYGITLGGPIVKDKLFFFVYYEEFERIEAGGLPGITPDPDALADVFAYNETLPFDFGGFGASGRRVQPDEKYLIKLDWNITDDHQLAVKYQKTEGEDPNVGNFADFGETALDSNFYRQLRTEEFYTAQLYSQWTDDLETEISFGYNKYRQPTTFDELTPHIFIDNFPTDDGISGSYTANGDGELFFGTEQFRHANILEVDTYNFSAIADYFAGDKIYTFGVDLEDTSFWNLFLESSFANFGFDNLQDYLDGTLTTSSQFNYRNTGVIGQNPVAVSDYRVTGAFAQVDWDVSPKLRLTGGVRLNYTTTDAVPPSAVDRNGVPFEDLFGMPNTGTIDGDLLIAPRISFNYKVSEEKDFQIRGGIGIFQGRAPGVWISNAYTNNGETSNRIDFNGIDNFDFVDYLNNELDQDNPILYIDKADGTPEVNVTEDGLRLPWIARGNLAIDYRLGESNWTMTVEALFTKNYDSLWVENINLAPAGTAPDGRTIYSGHLVDTYDDVFVLRNADRGEARNFAVTLRREQVDGWFANFTYVQGDATDINPFTSSRAVSNFYNRQVFDVNEPETSTSNFEIKHRFLVTAGVEFDLVDKYTTRIFAVYEGRTGRPYSVTFDTDVNGDGDGDNDLLYIPTGPNDPLVRYGGSFDTDAFFEFIEREGLSEYAGGAAPRNSQLNDWVHRVDLKLEQDIPIWEKVGLTFYIDFLNVLNMIDDDWGLTEEYGFPFQQRVVDATIDSATNQYLYSEFDPESNAVRTDGVRSRWAVQFGAKLSF